MSITNFTLPTLTQSFSERDSNLPIWLQNQMLVSNPDFTPLILDKLGHLPHYPNPVVNLGGMHPFTDSLECRIPGVQPFVQTILRKRCDRPNRHTTNCFEYGNTRFVAKCECQDRYSCRTSSGNCENCPKTCGLCNHNANVIFY
jgi:hypothetical protein